ncbi:hypothetical protein [Flavobacterium sp. TAB 87]|uniref:hypothetical protein n=1 Tax=Flavobacterium sp. TAB 87 TaxID=1729581 RepID=UPI00076CB3E8|nr:hypothetical protein [Flavobacterium sp. TAB 87]KVV14179.1 hypothetical protein AP058_02065 [Flavobacterium sp. TAB 87]
METENKKLWKDTVVFMQEDIKHQRNMFDKRDLDTVKKNESYQVIAERCNDFLVSSDLVLEELIRYPIFMEKGLECDDVQCDTYFTNYESTFEEEIKTHFERYNELKKAFTDQLL